MSACPHDRAQAAPAAEEAEGAARPRGRGGPAGLPREPVGPPSERQSAGGARRVPSKMSVYFLSRLSPFSNNSF